MSDQPLLRIQINGILLSTLLFECANARVDYEGLILGAIVSKTRSVADDASDARIKTVYTTVVVQGVYRLEPNVPKFYNRSGEILEQVLEQYNIPSNLSILGYLKYRRTESHQLSLRDKAVALSLKEYLERKRALSSPTSPVRPSSNPFAVQSDKESPEPFPVSMALFTAKTNENMSTHDYDYTFWSIGDDESSFTALPVEVSNMIESPQEDYQSFQSNLAIGASRHAASIGMMNTIKTVPTLMLIDGHEAMYKESFDATKSLTKSVLASELKVGEAIAEIERLKEQVERTRVEASKRKREREEQHLNSGAEQPHRPFQHQRSPHPPHPPQPRRPSSLLHTQVRSMTSSSPTVPSRPDLFSYGSSGSVGSPPDLLY
ncbi:hypothetical protein BGX28_006854 [Mortierella sp. GBA30]|nr:hypothetical protein BGX28_006854 [Mortierella sp. GBA30]